MKRNTIKTAIEIAKRFIETAKKLEEENNKKLKEMKETYKYFKNESLAYTKESAPTKKSQYGFNSYSCRFEVKQMIKLLNPEDINILVIGDIMLDIYNYGDAHRISPEAPVPVFLD